MSQVIPAGVELPIVDVRTVEYARTPRGSLVQVTRLACGHFNWRTVRAEARRPRTRAACVTCWLVQHLPGMVR